MGPLRLAAQVPDRLRCVRLGGAHLLLGAILLLTHPPAADAKRTWRPGIKDHVNHMQRVMGYRLSTWETTNWLAHWRNVRRKYLHPPNLRAWLCIHRYEGAWNDTGDPYWGGLQMNLIFQRTYGSYLLRLRGTANYWTPMEQIWVAEKARRSGRGFAPWPNTARRCGLY
jgi:hypothetical protein